MHTVPKIVKNSYRPLLKQALRYQPEAIYVEAARGDDDPSWEYLKEGYSKTRQRFYALSDSLQTAYQFDSSDHERILSKPFSSMSQEELQTLLWNFGYLRDEANYQLYTYVKAYGAKGSKKPTRHEDGDLSAKLALRLGIKEHFGIDYQAMNALYHSNAAKCTKEGFRNGDNKIANRLYRKDSYRTIIPAITGKLGKYNNKPSTSELYRSINAFSYVTQNTEACDNALRYWNLRDENIADNLGSQIRANPYKKSVAILGAGHVAGLKRYMEEKYPDIRVKVVYEK